MDKDKRRQPPSKKPFAKKPPFKKPAAGKQPGRKDPAGQHHADKQLAEKRYAKKPFDKGQAAKDPAAKRSSAPGRPGRSFAKPGDARPARTNDTRPARADGARPPRAEGTRPARPEGGRPARSEGARSATYQAPPRKSGAGFSRRPDKVDTRPSPKQTEGDRIAKVMARAGLCSRRDAETWIAEGRVAVNGKVLTSPALTILPTDEILVDGQPMAQRERSRLFLFHKPRGLVTTNKDPEGRTTVFDYLEERHPDLPRLVSVGRLDINTEGLLLLTNDGGLARVLELPTTGWLRRYRVRANGETDQAVLDRLADGVTIEGIHYAGIEAALDRVQGANNWMTIGLREGKNREIKRVLEHLGLAVNRLIRLSFGPFQLSELAEGAVEEVRTRVLRDQLGETLTQAAGVDFDSPLVEPPAPAAAQRPERRSEYQARDRANDRAPQRHLNPRPHRAKAEPEPEQEKVRTRPKPGPRKHISALRAEGAEASQQGRRRTVHSETADPKGRSVAVERRVAAKPETAKFDKSKPVRSGRPGGKSQNKSQDRPQGKRQDKPHGNKPGDRPPRRDEGRKPPRSPAPTGKRPPRTRS
jgi:23S rRNA pseudouridine2605 synthase